MLSEKLGTKLLICLRITTWSLMSPQSVSVVVPLARGDHGVRLLERDHSKSRLSCSFWFRLIQARQAHESLASIASLSVALQQLVLSKHCQW